MEGVTVRYAVSLAPHSVTVTSKQPVCSETYLPGYKDAHMPPAAERLILQVVPLSPVASHIQPNASVAVAINCCELPDSMLAAAGLMLMLTGQAACVTVRVQVPLTEELEARTPVTVQMPHATGVTLAPVKLAPAPALMVKLVELVTFPRSLPHLSNASAVNVLVLLTTTLLGHGARTR
jgi:hypothetical protein